MISVVNKAVDSEINSEVDTGMCVALDVEGISVLVCRVSVWETGLVVALGDPVVSTVVRFSGPVVGLSVDAFPIGIEECVCGQVTETLLGFKLVVRLFSGVDVEVDMGVDAVV